MDNSIIDGPICIPVLKLKQHTIDKEDNIYDIFVDNYAFKKNLKILALLGSTRMENGNEITEFSRTLLLKRKVSGFSSNII